jgi:hypothetical protein
MLGLLLGQLGHGALFVSHDGNDDDDGNVVEVVALQDVVTGGCVPTSNFGACGVSE